MHKIRYALFYDFHTSPLHPGVGKDFDADKLTDRFLECGVDYVTFHARCNMGMAYYNTKLGIRHPSLNFDLFGSLAEHCARKGIGIGAYLNGGLSRAEAVAHREWTTIYPDGSSYHEPFGGPFSQTMCYNTPYGDHLIAMAKEIASLYPVSGFFFDCMSAWPCVCPICVQKMQEQGLDFQNETQRRTFAVQSRNAFALRISQALKEIDPEYLLYFNDIPFEDQKEQSTYLEFECLPCKSGGYRYMHTQPHYMRTLGKQCVHMTGRFNQWSDFGGLRNAHTLKYELFYALANGLRPNIGDHLNPNGEVNEAVFDLVKEVYGELHKYDPYFDTATPVADTAIIWHDGATIRSNGSVAGAIRMLTELRIPFDTITAGVSWEPYQLLVFPDEVRLTPEMYERVKAHLLKGGKILTSGKSALMEHSGNFPEEWGVDYKGETAFTPAYFRTKVPGIHVNMDLSFYGKAYEVEARSASNVPSVLVRPAVNNGWDGVYPEYYNPPSEETALPFLTLSNGNLAHFSGEIFKGYDLKAAVPVRDLVKYALDSIQFKPLIRLEKAPFFIKAYVGKDEEQKRVMVSFLSCLPEKRGLEMESCEGDLPSGNFQLCLKTDQDPVKVYMAQDEANALPFYRDGEYLCVQIPGVTGFGMVVFEFGSGK